MSVPDSDKSKEGEDARHSGALRGDEVRSIFGQPDIPRKPSSLFEPSTAGLPTKPAPAVPGQVPVSRSAFVRAPVRGFHHKQLLPFGIDIGYSSLKVAQLALEDNKVIASKLILEEYPPELINDTQNRDQKLKDFLVTVAAKHDLKGEAFSTLEADRVEFKNIVLPKMPPAEIEGALHWELKRMYGEKLEQYSYDYMVLGQNRMVQYERTSILLIIARKQEVLNHLGLFADTDLKITAVEAGPLSLLAGIEYNQETAPSEVVLVLDAGAQATRLNIIKNRELHFTRILNINGQSLTRAIKDYCQVSYKEAEEYKRNFGKQQGVSSDPAASMGKNLQIRNAITLQLEKMVSDIDHTFKYYSYQMTKSEVRKYDKIILSGGTANFHMLGPFLRDRLNVPVEISNPFKSIAVSEATAKEFRLEDEAVRFGIAAGLALRGLEDR